MRKAFIIPAILLCVVLAVPAQAQWAKAYGSILEENPLAALLIEEGKLLIAGFRRIASGSIVDYAQEYEPWLIQISTDGNEVARQVLNSNKPAAEIQTRRCGRYSPQRTEVTFWQVSWRAYGARTTC
jgi:hypothetical protein